MSTTTTSPGAGKLNLNDFLKGLLIATLSTPITIITQTLNSGTLIFDWKTIGIVALASGLSYIVKNLLTPAQITLNNPDPELLKKVQEGKSNVIILPK